MEIKLLAKTFLFRFLVALLAVAGGTALIVWGPYLQARSIVGRQAEAIGQAEGKVAAAFDELNRVRSPEQVSLAELNSWKEYAEQIEKTAGRIETFEISLPRPIVSERFQEYTSKVNNLLSDEAMKVNYEEVGSSLEDLEKLLTYHGRVIRALLNLMEYNAGKDFQNFALGNEDTNKRLGLAKEGLAKVATQLGEARGYEDPTLNVIKETVLYLQNGRDKLEKDGHVNLWKEQVITAQETIRKNRSEFWGTEATTIANRLTKLEQSLPTLRETWQTIRQ